MIRHNTFNIALAFIMPFVLANCDRPGSGRLEIVFPNDFNGVFVLQVDPNGMDTSGRVIRMAIPPNRLIKVTSLKFLNQWREYRIRRENGEEISLFNDEAYNANKVGLRLVHSEDEMAVYILGTESDRDLARSKSIK